MKNYYAILEVPVGCRLEEIRQAYHRLLQENMDDDAAFADLKEAYEVLTTPGRREEYDQAAWGETFGTGTGNPGDVPRLTSPTGRCPMGSDAQCPVLRGRLIASDKYCPECGFLLAGLDADGAVKFPEAAPVRQVWLEEMGGQTHRLRTGLNIVGREGADVLLPDKTVSRQHARLDVGADGTVTVEDLSSTNGTAAGGETLVPHILRRLSSGDGIRFGSVGTLLRVAAPAEAAPEVIRSATPPEAFDEDSVPSGMPDITPPAVGGRGRIVQSRDGEEQTHQLLPGITSFGRRTDNTVVLPGDPYVSGSHAQILAEGDFFQITDVGSTNGTLLNGTRMAINSPAVLSDGDVVLIGSTALRFERTPEPDAPSPETAPAEATEPEADAHLAQTDTAADAESNTPEELSHTPEDLENAEGTHP